MPLNNNLVGIEEILLRSNQLWVDELWVDQFDRSISGAIVPYFGVSWCVGLHHPYLDQQPTYPPHTIPMINPAPVNPM